MQTDTKPDVTERYVTAINTSNLKTEADRGGAADVLIASGWSPTRLGSALLRLVSTGRNLSEVYYQLEIMADKANMDNPSHVAASVMGWWLDKTCKACSGQRFQVIHGTPTLSTKACKCCRGTGETPLPCGEAGRQMAAYMDDCISRARQSIRARLHGMR